MDLVTTGLMQGQSEETKQREEAARPNGKGSVENPVDRLENTYGLSVDQTQLLVRVIAPAARPRVRASRTRAIPAGAWSPSPQARLRLHGRAPTGTRCQPPAGTSAAVWSSASRWTAGLLSS